jgi:hypothetical protein
MNNKEAIEMEVVMKLRRQLNIGILYWMNLIEEL